jgi:amino acid adenylation domain-containing protein
MTLDVSTQSPFLRADFSTELFDEATAAALLTHFHTLLRSVVEQDGEPAMVGAEEHRLLTEGWNPPVQETPAVRPSVLQSFCEHAAEAPGDIALVHRGRPIGYRELDEWSTRIAARLRDAGAGKASRVGLLLGRSPAMIAAILAVWKVNAAYVPLDPGYPGHRLELILDSAEPSTIVVTAEHRELAEQLAGHRDIALLGPGDPGGNPGDAGDPGTPTAWPGAEDLAYVLYTSGSTGVPKGVMVRHRGLNALFGRRPVGLDVDGTDRWLAAHSFSFDVSVLEICGALTSGSRLVIADEADLVDPHRLARLILAEHVTVVNLTPSALYRVLPPFFDTLRGARSPVRYVVLVGEALSWSRLAALVDPERMPAVFVNMYGVTEGTIVNTVAEVPAAELAQVREGSIGVPLPANRCYVLDERQQPAGVNVPGELCIAGELTAAGYIGRPDLTAARFGRDPFAPGEFYRTGDIVRWAPDGHLVYIGREDTQVKVRGHRVELADVEAAFLRQPGVRACVAVVDADELLAFVCRDPGTGGEKELRALVREELPGYMVPSRILTVAQIPLNGNGKADRRQLVEESRTAEAAVPAPPAADPATRDTLTARIRQIWAEVLRRPELEATDNFFDVGGSSFALITVQQRMAETGLDLSVTDLFRYGTVAACAGHFRKAQTPPDDDRAALRKRGRDELARRRRISRGHGHG